ncbi:hypothetical protein DFP72DRAFT_920934 [Ephemerocybe angulata]|uniref:Uncharacterized protein n=1 Tax=Ephemerocybe angulata TaxID=980116 RepID=A0A8H6HIM4_9AGAR|nr:hypothetical protein DFP72DRAFT_920934 [Tulosesus angulatus]
MGAADHPSSHGAYNCEKLSVSRPTTYPTGGWRRLEWQWAEMDGGRTTIDDRAREAFTHASMRQTPPPHPPHWGSRLALAAGIVTHRDTALRPTRAMRKRTHQNPRATADDETTAATSAYAPRYLNEAALTVTELWATDIDGQRPTTVRTSHADPNTPFAALRRPSTI